MLKRGTVMAAALALGSAIVLGFKPSMAQSQQDAMKQHMEEGTRGVSPETTHAKDKATAAEQSKAMKEQAMQRHMEEGTRGVTPHETKRKKKQKQGSASSEAMQQHVQEGTKGVSPHALPQKDK